MKKDAEIEAVFGARGSGKSTLARSRVAQAKRLIVLDPTMDWQSELPRAVSVSNIGALSAAMSKRWKTGFRIVYNLPAGRAPEGLHHVSELLWQYQGAYLKGVDDRKITLVVEEMAEAYDNSHARRKDLIGFHRVILQGRHAGIGVVGISQRPADVAARFRDNARSTFVLQLSDFNSQEAIAKLTGKEYREQIRKLAKFHYLHLRDGEVTAGKVKKPR